ncbi:hypothetical protein RUM43_013774 [Polyplax serrata]|uniref:Ionotropic glutamate receptor C-terminal domain-containing protein n=1 Tax=Polyplax serrata TaxID=468196 RepID=A0AAN8P4M3_POLSC
MTPFEWENPHPCNENCDELESKFNLVNCLWFSLGSLMGQGCDILPKVSPFEWKIPRPTRNKAEELETNMNFINSIWHNCGSLMQQGSDIAPKAVSTRIVAGMWWFFTLIMISSYTANLAAFLTIDRMEIEIDNVEDLAKQTKIKYGAVADASTAAFFKSGFHCLKMLIIVGRINIDTFHRAVSTRLVAGMWWFFTLIMISSYTANLAAFLTVERMDVAITSAEDLAKQTKIKYGAVIGGSTAAFFKNSNFSTYQRMWAAMESARPSVFTTSNAEGVERVVKGKRSYAFLMESTSIEYQVERNCELQQIGDLLDSKGYGIAMPVNSPYRTAISGAVLKMQEDGRLHMMKEKWWKEMYGGGSCKDDHAHAAASQAELGLANVGGVFVVLVLGCTAGFFMAVMEFLWNIRKIAVEEQISPKEALIMELKFALSCMGTKKPIGKRKQSMKSSQSGTSSLQLNNFE